MSSLTEDDVGPGGILARVREEQGLSQRSAADQLNLPIHIVDAIETDDVERLPAEVFTRGYIRAYARLLDLDPDPLLTALKFEQKVEPVEPATTASVAQISAGMVKNGGIAAAVVVILFLGWWVFVPADLAESEIVAVQETSSDVVTQSGEARSSIGQQHLPKTQQVTQRQKTQLNVITEGALQQSAVADQVVNSQAEDSSDGSDVYIADMDEPVEATQTVSNSNVRRLTPEGSERLSLIFTEDCWVEIRAKDNGILYADLGKAEREWHFRGQAPFQLLIGYAPGVLVEYNGEPISLAPHTRNNVARLVLGQ